MTVLLGLTGTADGEITRADPKTSYDMQAHQYPATGPTGIHLEQHTIQINGHTTTIDCLLYRNHHGTLLGIFNHYNHNNPTQTPGSCNIWVHPDHQHQGIASVLLRDAWHRWPLHLANQTWTPDGHAWIRGLETKNKINLTHETSINENLDWTPPLDGVPSTTQHSQKEYDLD